MSACAGQDLSVLGGGLMFPGYLIYVNADDAHDDGSGKCDSIVDRWSGKTFTNISSATRFSIVTASLPGHKTFGTGGAGGKFLSLVDAIAASLVGIPDYTMISYFMETNLLTESQVISFTDVGPNNTTMYSTFSPSSGSKHLLRNGGGPLATASVAYARTLTGFHQQVNVKTGGSCATYLDGVLKGSSAFSTLGQDPASLATITLGGGITRCEFHQWAVYTTALSAADIATSYALMVAAAA